MHGGVDAVLWVGADDWGVAAKEEGLARGEAGLNEIAEGEDATEAGCALSLQDFDVVEQVAGLDAGDDVELCEAGDVGLVDEFGVFDAKRRRDGEMETRSG